MILKNNFSFLVVIVGFFFSGQAQNDIILESNEKNNTPIAELRELLKPTGSEHFASEFKELGYGVFTYALLQGLSCNADGTMKDKKVTIQELAAYLNDNIPALTEKYHGTVQYPKSWSKGMDFPISVCKQLK